MSKKIKFNNELDNRLYEACCPEYPDYEIIESLLNKGANVNATDERGENLLQHLIYDAIQGATVFMCCHP
ncbi:MAG: hypothetical protein ISS11_08180 [Candidatus Marinimicrobia bacterium]|nr:hypothetical protein [Candidatus Neomarinimicrobiota bacterium]